MILDSKSSVDTVRELYEEYSRQVGVDLCVQNFSAELAGLPNNYDVILIARDGEFPAGCAALRNFKGDRTVAELKRLYVRASHRGFGIGKRLTEAILGEARNRGYRSLRLDTLPTMTTAIAMYRTMGFEQILPESGPEFPGQLFFQIRLELWEDNR